MNIEFEYGFIVRLEKNKDDKKESAGVKLSSLDYSLVYKDLDYATRIKMKEILDDFMDNPIKQVE